MKCVCSFAVDQKAGSTGSCEGSGDLTHDAVVVRTGERDVEVFSVVVLASRHSCDSISRGLFYSFLSTLSRVTPDLEMRSIRDVKVFSVVVLASRHSCDSVSGLFYSFLFTFSMAPPNQEMRLIDQIVKPLLPDYYNAQRS